MAVGRSDLEVVFSIFYDLTMHYCPPKIKTKTKAFVGAGNIFTETFQTKKSSGEVINIYLAEAPGGYLID